MRSRVSLQLPSVGPTYASRSPSTSKLLPYVVHVSLTAGDPAMGPASKVDDPEARHRASRWSRPDHSAIDQLDAAICSDRLA